MDVTASTGVFLGNMRFLVSRRPESGEKGLIGTTNTYIYNIRTSCLPSCSIIDVLILYIVLCDCIGYIIIDII